MNALTDRDKRTLTDAQELDAVLSTPSESSPDEDATAHAVTLTQAQLLLNDLNAVVEHLTDSDNTTEDTHFDAKREILHHYN